MSDVVIRERRRVYVRDLLMRGWEISRIQEHLSKEFVSRDGQAVPNPYYITNPETNQPYSYATIQRDYYAATESLQADFEAIIENQSGVLHARLEQLYSLYIANRDLDGAHNVLKTQIRLAKEIHNRDDSGPKDTIEEVTRIRDRLLNKIKDVEVYDEAGNGQPQKSLASGEISEESEGL